MTTAAEILSTVTDHWKLEQPVPTMRPGWWRCGHCGDRRFTYRSWSFFEYPEGRPHRVQHRANVEIKCGACYALTRFGIPIPPEYYAETYSHGGIRRDVEARYGLLLVAAWATTRRLWHRAKGHLTPDRALRCAACGEQGLRVRHRKQHHNSEGELVVDISTKCWTCSATALFEPPA